MGHSCPKQMSGKGIEFVVGDNLRKLTLQPHLRNRIPAHIDLSRNPAKGRSLMQRRSIPELTQSVRQIDIEFGIPGIEIINPFPRFSRAFRKAHPRKTVNNGSLDDDRHICLSGIETHQLRFSSAHRLHKT